MKTLVTLGLGALAMYLLDPQQGRARRTRVRERLARAKRRVERAAAAGKTPDLSYREYVGSADAPQGAPHLGR